MEFVANIENIEKHGTKTTIEITRILGFSPTSNSEFEINYQFFCNHLGVNAQNRDHKFWAHNLDTDFNINKSVSWDFPEGKILEKMHKYYERSSALIDEAKANFKKSNESLFCQVCDFDFAMLNKVLHLFN